MKTRTVALALALPVALAAYAWTAGRQTPAPEAPTAAVESSETDLPVTVRAPSAAKARPPAFTVPSSTPQIDPVRKTRVLTEIGAQKLAEQTVLAAQMGLTMEQTERFTTTLAAFNDEIVAAFQAHVLDVEAKRGRATSADLDAYIAAIAKADEKFRAEFEAIDPKVRRAIKSGDFNAMALPDGRVSANALALAERYPDYMMQLASRF
jgi:hypothetical protein